MRLKLIWCFSVLIHCHTLANGGDLDGYPSEIRCVVNKFGGSYPNSTWEKQTAFPKGYYWLDELVKHRFVDRNHAISYEHSGLIMGKSGSDRDCFGVHIWKMGSSEDTKKLSNALYEAWWFVDFLAKPFPTTYFVFKEYIIWVYGCSYATRFNAGTEQDKMIKMCFESDIESDWSWESGATTVTLTQDGVLRVSGNGAMGDGKGKKAWKFTSIIERVPITAVVIEDGVTRIGEYAFQSSTDLTSVTIPNSVTKIGDGAFAYCKSLTSVGIPNSVAEIGNGAFSLCESLTSVAIPNSVTKIGNGAFQYCKSLASVTLPDGITEINGGMFSDCPILTSVKIPNSVTQIGPRAFYGCRSLASVTIPSGVTKIEKEAFNGCTSLTSVTIPNGVTEIGKEAFNGCIGLTSVTIPNSVTEIGARAFEGCASLTSVNIPGSVAEVRDNTFTGCKSLASVTIENGVKIIGNSAFTRCKELSFVKIPASVTEIKRDGFWKCSPTIMVVSQSPTPPKADPNAFDGFDRNYATLIVPASSIDAYRAADGWREFDRVLAIAEAKNGGLWITLCGALAAVAVLFAAVFIIIKKSRRSSNPVPARS